MKFALAVMALLSGAALAVQVGMNNTLRARMTHPMLAALASFAIGTAVLLVYVLVTRPTLPDRASLVRGPWWIWGGGLVGAVYVASASAFAGRLGAAAWLGLIVAGQVVASIVMDHYGLIGFARRPMNLARLAGATLILIGVLLVLWSPKEGTRDAHAPKADRVLPDGAAHSASETIMSGSRG